MCQQIIDFCNGATKPLLYIGATLIFLLALAIGYYSCTTQAMFNSIDSHIAGARFLGYYIQLAVTGYLVLVAIGCCAAAYSDQKHTIRVLAVLCILNCIMAVALVVVSPKGHEVSQKFEPTLNNARAKYNFTDAPHQAAVDIKDDAKTPNESESNGRAMNLTDLRPKRMVAMGEQDNAKFSDQRILNSSEATRIWDSLQSFGCCGLNNYTSTWLDRIPKSCCSSDLVKSDNGYYRCEKVDQMHQGGCLQLISSSSYTFSIVLLLIAVVNMYIGTVAGISSYKTFHYSEASQSAYT